MKVGPIIAPRAESRCNGKCRNTVAFAVFAFFTGLAVFLSVHTRTMLMENRRWWQLQHDQNAQRIADIEEVNKAALKLMEEIREIMQRETP